MVGEQFQNYHATMLDHSRLGKLHVVVRELVDPDITVLEDFWSLFPVSGASVLSSFNIVGPVPTRVLAAAKPALQYRTLVGVMM